MPTYYGKQITLRHLAEETSGLRPWLGDAIDPERADAPFEGFTAEKFYALVFNYRLTAAGGGGQPQAGRAAVVGDAAPPSISLPPTPGARGLRPWAMTPSTTEPKRVSVAL